MQNKGIIIASFDSVDRATKAGGALLDHGLKEEHFSLLGGKGLSDSVESAKNLGDHEKKITDGVTTSTRADAAEGAAVGAVGGIVLGALAGLASLFIPGYGVVIGGGALATAVGSAVGTSVAGAVAGGATGYLRDLGVDEKIAVEMDKNVKEGGAIISLRLPSGDLTEAEAMEIVRKYRANRIEHGHAELISSR